MQRSTCHLRSCNPVSMCLCFTKYLTERARGVSSSTMERIRLVSRTQEQPPALHDRAMDNLRYIRETMERATPFTGISGRGEIAIGATALVASVIAAQQPTFKFWLAVWIAEGLISAPDRRLVHGSQSARGPDAAVCWTRP